MKSKHICDKKMRTVKVKPYVAIRDGEVVIVKPHRRCPPKK